MLLLRCVPRSFGTQFSGFYFHEIALESKFFRPVGPQSLEPSLICDDFEKSRAGFLAQLRNLRIALGYMLVVLGNSDASESEMNVDRIRDGITTPSVLAKP